MAQNIDYSRLNTYNGDQPYIFVSYAHKDSRIVVPIICALQDRGYRIWFDLGIEAGTEWSNNIAAHLQGCATFLVFASKNSVQSENCLDEIAFAKAHQKPSLMVFLEDDVVLPAGTEMQTARFQRMFRSRHHSEETFIQKICEATILDICREGGTAPVSAPAPAAKSAVKLPLVIGLSAVLIAAIVALVMAFSSGDSPLTPTSPPAAETTATEAAAPAELVMSDDLMDYTFTLDGIVYQLPCAFSDFTDRGWTISSTDYNSDSPIAGDSYESFRMSNNGRSIYVSVYNYSGNTRRLADCPIGQIECEISDGVEFSIAKGIVPGSTVDEIIAAFGTPSNSFSGTNYVELSYTDDASDYNGVSFTCYSDQAMSDDSYISLRNFVKLSSDATETSAEYPQYLSSYTAPMELGNNLLSGIVSIEGDLYHLPAPVSAFVDNGWTITSQPGYLVAGGSEYIYMERDGAKIDLGIMNFSDYQTIPNNCAVYSISVYDGDDAQIILPGGITMGSAMTLVQSAITDEFEVYQGSDYIGYNYWEYSERVFDISICVTSGTQVVDMISLSQRTWIH